MSPTPTPNLLADAMARRYGVGDMAERIAARLWPDLRLLGPGHPLQIAGLDAVDGRGRGVQIKGDARIAGTGRVYCELFAKTGPEVPWWGKSARVEEYVFVTRGLALRIAVDAWADLAALRRPAVQQIHRTSIGYFLALEDLLPRAEVLEHGEWTEDAA